jgi:hypothetical protein
MHHAFDLKVPASLQDHRCSPHRKKFYDSNAQPSCVHPEATYHKRVVPESWYVLWVPFQGNPGSQHMKSCFLQLNQSNVQNLPSPEKQDGSDKIDFLMK